MKCAVLEKPNKISIGEKQLSALQEGQLRVKVELAGICSATELHYYRGELENHFPLDSFNSYFGHEGCGTVLEVGPSVTAFSPGDRVTYLGPSYTEESIVSTSRAVKIPSALDFEQAIGEPLAVVANTLDHYSHWLGQEVLLTGAGSMGLLLVQGLRSAGARVTVCEPHPKRAELARELGAERVITKPDTAGDELAARFAVAIEASGATSALALCSTALAANGVLIIHSFFPKPVQLDMLPWHCKQVTVINSHIPTDQELRGKMEKGLKLTQQGILDMSRLVTHRWRLDELDKAFGLLDKAGFSIKMVVRP